MTSRRKFLTASTLGIASLGLTSLGLASATGLGKIAKANEVFGPQALAQQTLDSDYSKIEKIFPAKLFPGARIAITAPASPTSEYDIRHAVRFFKKMGCKVEVGQTIKNHKLKWRYFSASEQERAEEFMSYIEREDINCILCGRGGYGVMRILDKLDFEVIKKNPKIIIGFSDITALLNSISKITGIVSFHGPVASSSFSNFTKKSLQDVIFNTEQPFEISYQRASSLNEGTCQGRLVGGNLKMIASTIGTPFEIDTRDSILFLEDTGEHPYKIDRMLTQLKLSGKLDECNGFIFGTFKKLNQRVPFYPNKSFTLSEVIDQVIKPLGKPVLIGMPFGHIKNKITLPIGSLAMIDTEKKLLRLLESPTI